jgi:hypothetical protein
MTFTELSCELPDHAGMAANGLNVVAVRIEDKCPVVVRMIVGPKPWPVVVVTQFETSFLAAVGPVRSSDGLAPRRYGMGTRDTC